MGSSYSVPRITLMRNSVSPGDHLCGVFEILSNVCLQSSFFFFFFFFFEADGWGKKGAESLTELSLEMRALDKYKKGSGKHVHNVKDVVYAQGFWASEHRRKMAVGQKAIHVPFCIKVPDQMPFSFAHQDFTTENELSICAENTSDHLYPPFSSFTL